MAATNHLLPFLWVHGEDEATYRKMVNVIHDANIGAFCVEARPHPEFVKEQWWKDMGILLDEAEKLGMKVWILDDKHFPTGYAAGAMEDAPLEQRRCHMAHRSIPVAPGATVKVSVEKSIRPKEKFNLLSFVMMAAIGGGIPKKVRRDQLISCTAYSSSGRIDLTEQTKGGTLEWQAPADGAWTIEIVSSTYDVGPHRNYINMMDEASCARQVAAVYQPHYEHFGDKFGTVIAGFFSDEPELGNGDYTKTGYKLGMEQFLPYSGPLERELEKRLGGEWRQCLPLLWRNDYDSDEIARVRYLYMDAVTRLVEECFSRQIGMWCRDHGVEYIGHLIEDNNQHARTNTSLGHYFRGLKWQTMAGIDDIGGQVEPGHEDYRGRSIFGYEEDGEFFHYALGKMGASMGQLSPHMQGRTMCEIFGNYGWKEGVRLEKYLIDHFMVRGVNYFVPHAFTCSAYPEKDCPPHFYAQGNNPQYRHFGALMKYANNVCNLISGGRIDAGVGVLYHAEAEWAGECMLMQKPGRVLQDNQIDFNYIPSDVFEEREFYRTQVTDMLTVNGREHHVMIVPYARYLSRPAAEGLSEMIGRGGRVAFVDALPEGVATGEALPENIGKADVISLNQVAAYAGAYRTVELMPAHDRIRAMHYLGEHEVYYFVNEAQEAYAGTALLPGAAEGFIYDPWNDENYPLAIKDGRISLNLEPGHSLIVIAGERGDVNPVSGEAAVLSAPVEAAGEKIALTRFTQSVCRSIDYPAFTKEREITSLEGYERTDPKFSGFIRYVAAFETGGRNAAVLEITDACEGVEVFVNGESLGIQIQPTYRYDLTPALKDGENELVIEVATTLARERGKKEGATGITGGVYLYLANR